jgi:hypothetical protein
VSGPAPSGHDRTSVIGRVAPGGPTGRPVNATHERRHRTRRLADKLVEPNHPGRWTRSVAGDPVPEAHGDAHSTTSSGRWLSGPSLEE